MHVGLNKKLFLENGYLNIPWILSRGFAFNIVVGGRGTGKTYGAIQHFVENGIFTIFMRRTQTQADVVMSPTLSSFKEPCDDLGIPYMIKGLKGVKNVRLAYFGENCDEDCENPQPGALCVALSTFSNIRGASVKEAELLVFDEFIGEPHEKRLKNEDSAFFNTFETVNRNRELQGKKPMQAILFSNADTFDSPLLMELKLINTIVSIKEGDAGQGVRDFPDRDLSVIVLQDSEISKKKENTALYRLTEGTRFREMSLGNTFDTRGFKYVKSMSLKPFNLGIEVGEIYIYTHKAERLLYVSTHRKGTARYVYASDPPDLKRFKLENAWLKNMFLSGEMRFETPTCQMLLTKYLE